MFIKDDFDFGDLQDRCWEGAIYTLDKIFEADKEDEFMDFLEGIFTSIPTLTKVNDLLWHESEFVLDSLGINEDEEDEDEEEE